MKYFHVNNTIKVENGYFDFHTILQFRGVNIEEVEKSLPNKYSLNNPLAIKVDNTELNIASVHYLGKNSFYEISLSYEKIYLLPSQKVLVKNPDILKPDYWDIVQNLTTNDILSPNLSIKEIKPNAEINHLYGIELDDDSICYIQNNIQLK